MLDGVKYIQIYQLLLLPKLEVRGYLLILLGKYSHNSLGNLFNKTLWFEGVLCCGPFKMYIMKVHSSGLRILKYLGG